MVLAEHTDIMRRCNNCGSQVAEDYKFCSNCGGSDFSDVTNVSIGTIPNLRDSVQNSYTPIGAQIQAVENLGTKLDSVNNAENSGNGNVIAGIVGAFLLSLIGAVIYFVIYQIGIITGISALIMFVLADFGYGLFAKTNRKTSSLCLIVSIIITIAMIFFSEYFCLSFEIFKAYKSMGITIFDAIRATPEFLPNPDVRSAVESDLAYAYAFGALATVGDIINRVKQRKKQK